jgi:hypothetical protein
LSSEFFSAASYLIFWGYQPLARLCVCFPYQHTNGRTIRIGRDFFCLGIYKDKYLKEKGKLRSNAGIVWARQDTPSLSHLLFQNKDRSSFLSFNVVLFCLRFFHFLYPPLAMICFWIFSPHG